VPEVPLDELVEVELLSGCFAAGIFIPSPYLSRMGQMIEYSAL
jgi:hypothetical protein